MEEMFDEMLEKGYPLEYVAMLKAEKKAEENLKRLAKEIAQECYPIWRKGDGCGGTILWAIKDEFQKLGFETEPYTSKPSKNRSKIDHKVRTMVFERDAYRCVKCGSYKQLCIDHRFPYSRGGSNDPDNLQTLCWTCNSKKGNKIEVVE